MSNPPTTSPEPGPSAASRRWAQGGPRDETIATKRRRHRPRAPLTPGERAVLDELLADGPPPLAGQPPHRRVPQPTAPAAPADVDEPADVDVSAVALLLHTVVPPATDHAYRKLADTAGHLAGRHGLDLDGKHAELLAEQFTDPDQLHRFAHEPTEQRVILALLVDPLVDQILDLLGQLPSDLHQVVLAEAALATRLLDPSTQPAVPPPPADATAAEGSSP